MNLPSGGETTFLSEVWFISKLDIRNLLWGTGGLKIIDPYFEIPLNISARGQYGIRISNGALFMLKLVGTIKFASTELVINQFRIDIIETVRQSISQFMKEKEKNITELATEYKQLSQFIFSEIDKTFESYGVELINFNIEDISFDETDISYKTVVQGIAEKARLKKLGVSYLQQKQIEIAQSAAMNEGAGNVMGLGIGLSAGQEIGGMIKNNIKDVANTFEQDKAPELPSYYLAKDGKSIGPFFLDKIQEMVNSTEITKQTLICRKGSQDWSLAGEDMLISPLFKTIQ
ncbi:MAG: hypothetical protein BGN96_11225 [Bacteroidales bacterium 45-6]|nr:MAG: hypothetical protein BGN96_11225 [Bacteroidales bacterium 45-6]